MLHNQRRAFAAAVSLLEQAQPYNLAALKASSRHPRYRLCYRANLRELARSHLGLADHVRLATTAEKLANFGDDSPTDTYIAACILCRCIRLADKADQLPEARRKELANSYADRALALLRQAVALGFNDAEHMNKNPDLEPLRARAEFRKLLDELKGKREEEPLT
jgi:hypothetical protein